MTTATDNSLLAAQAPTKAANVSDSTGIISVFHAVCELPENYDNSVPVLAHPNAVRFGWTTKLVPVEIDGKLNCYEQHKSTSRLTVIRRDSGAKIRSLGLKVPHVDYDPILRDGYFN